MDSFSINIKVEKANAMKKHRQLQKIASLFRFVEVCVVLALISRFSIQLPVAVKMSSVYFKDLSAFLISPRFVFVIGNIIVITLFAKSGHLAGKNSANDIYEEFVEKSDRIQGINRYESRNIEAQNREKQSISALEKQSNCVQNIPEKMEKQSSSVFKEEEKKEEICTSLAIKNFERSQSEKLELCSLKNSYRELRRTGTEKCRGSVDCKEGWVKITYPEDRMSNEEFKSTIESFIERQKRFRRDEENYYCILH